MDDQVLRSLMKWPNVPDCFGWLALDRRGQWRMRDEFTQQNYLPGQVIKHAALIDFIARNYARDETGRYFFQNGPQRVFITLDALTLMHYKAVVELSADGTVKSFNDTAKMEMTPAGKFKFANDSQELLDLLDQTLQAILSATTNTIFGPQPFVNLADFAVIKAKLATLKE